jgi:hypothetical protein
MSKLNGKWINKDTDNLTHLGDNLAVKFSDDEAPDSNKVWSSEKISTISGSLQTEIDGKSDVGHTHDDRYYTKSEVDASITTVSGLIPTDYYTTGQVDTISGALNDKISAVGGVDAVEYLTLDAGDISNKYIDLSNEPATADDTVMDIIGGGPQLYGTDYAVVSGTQLTWNGYDLDGLLEATDKMRVSYTYTA